MLSLPYIEKTQTETLLRQILAGTKDAVVAESLNGCLLAVNSRFLELVGWTQSYTGQPLDQLIAAWVAQPSAPTGVGAYFRSCRSNEDSHGPEELKSSSGHVIEARCVLTQGQDAPFRIWFFQEWRTSALAWVGHEIKNPLNAVLGFSELLTEALEKKNDEAVTSSLRGLKIGTKHLQAVLGDLLDLSRLESGLVESRPEWVNLEEFVGEVDALFRSRHVRRGLEFVVEAPHCPGLQLWVDPARLNQILSNLLANSLRFTKRGWVALRVSNHADRWEFVVEDSGVGIPLDQQKTIFEPFVQTQGQNTQKFGGSGLGLAICRSLAQSLDGDLSLESEPGHGSRFTLSLSDLRVRSAEGQCGDHGSENRQNATSNVTLLVADDERTNLLLVQGFLRGMSVKVIEALDGFQAVELWKAKRPEVMLMDLRMPGLSGLEAARRIQALDPRGATRLLAMSATKPTAIELMEGRTVWSGFLEKPFSRQEILNFLSKHLTIVDDSSKSS